MKLLYIKNFFDGVFLNFFDGFFLENKIYVFYFFFLKKFSSPHEDKFTPCGP